MGNFLIFKNMKVMQYFLLILMLFLFSGCGCKTHLRPCSDPVPFEPFYIPEQIRIALVLGSGGVRGMAHVGAIEEIVAAGIPIDLIVGCSAGSIVGALYADNPDIEILKCAVSELKSHSLFDIEVLNCRYGISQGKNMNKVLDSYLEAETFDELQIPLVVVATDLWTGELIPIGSGDLVKAVQASCSIPFVFVPCELNGRILVDGSVIDPVPVRVAKDLGANIVIAVDLCELLEPTFPHHLFSIASRSAEIAFMWQNGACTKDADVIIRPKTCDVGAFNDKKKEQLYEAGKKAAHEQIPKILRLIQEKCPNKEPLHLNVVELEPYDPPIYLQ